MNIELYGRGKRYFEVPGELIKEVCTPEELYEYVLDKCKSGICNFSFTKKDRSIRTVVGTLNRDLIPACTHKEYEALKQAYTGMCLKIQDAEDLTDLKAEAGNVLEREAAGKKSVKKSAEYLSVYDLSKPGWIQFHVDYIHNIVTF